MPSTRTLRIAADVGGTFTDVIVLAPGGDALRRKVPSTPPHYQRGVLHAIESILQEESLSGESVALVCHGTTVATNTVLEHRGARTALITTRGFRDVLELRRVRAPQIYDLFFVKPQVLIDRHLRLELSERIAADGEVLTPVDETELSVLADQLEEAGVESVAVCLLHSYAFDGHERQVGRFLRRRLPNMPCSLSCEVLRERREYERTATTSVNAYIQPLMRRYLESLQSGLLDLGIGAPLLIMQSAGGLTPAQDAADRPVFALESGPAAGVLAAAHVAVERNLTGVISFDMGGTTAKASIIEHGRVAYSSEYEVGSSVSAGNRLTGGGGELILAPSIDLAEVGAGGGSIAYLDAAGGLRVGPRSAGAVPGPACYRQGGDEPTVTDANVVLGYIKGGSLAGGDVSIDLETARRAIETKIARPLNMDALEAARGIHAIANARMMRALREVSTGRGRDPRDFVLVAFGGSGPVHAAGLARELGTAKVIVPPVPGLFSAVGLLVSAVEHHDVRSCQLAGAGLTAEAVGRLFDEMRDAMSKQFRAESFASDQLQFATMVDMRYIGQASQLRIALQGGAVDDVSLGAARSDFEQEHQRLYGHRCEPGSPMEVVAVRLVGRVLNTADADVRSDHNGSPDGTRAATFDPPFGTMETPVVSRAKLSESTRGPLLVDEYDATIVVPPDMVAVTDPWGNLVMEFSVRED